MGDQSIGYTPEEAISVIGFGKFQGLILVFAGLGWISEAMEMMILSFVGVAVQSEWGLSPAEESLITSVVFAGMLVGCSFWGIISDAYGRRKAFIGTMILVAVAGICSSLSPSYKLFLVSRCMLGFGVGGGQVFAAWFMEFIPTANRGVWVIALTSFWSFGSVVEALLAWIIMPRFGWRWLIGLSCLPSFIVLLLSGITPESPRYLCVKGKMEEAQKILAKAAAMNKTILPPGMLILDRTAKIDEHYPLLDTSLLSSARERKCSSDNYLSSLFMIFSSKLRKTTLLLWFLYFSNTFSYYGIVLLTSELSSNQINCSSTINILKSAKDASLYRDVFITSFADLAGLVISAAILDRLGRKLTMKILCSLGFILLLPLVVHQNEILTTALLFGSRMFVMSSSNAVVIYSREVYPTSVRATGVGSATSIGRIGGMICPLVAVGLVRDCHQTAAIVLFEAVILLTGFCMLFLPIETGGKGLSDTTSLLNEE
ncbi:organic cation/carnitine transporter 7 [Coffea arabica]|uniref:Organic cation/carnitine transporter 7 n=1 Tax=Coffea arabica TaxID=13443 RepID=A0A6P6T2E6_COFAR|nr:organic cation/carnitine transporter 7-like [Coffea arabica]XP_027072178.1 organic cation/carnitine transporter 7-like [Coffea arabica]XP_027072179.1 organic cation/carnitine transporter 7-like [Coffea arabica]